MRALIFMCEPRHQAAIQAELLRCAHCLLAPQMSAVIAFDVDAGRVQAGQADLMNALALHRPHATEATLVVAAREVANKLKLSGLSKLGGFELLIQSAGVMTRVGGNTSFVNSQVNQSGLSVVGGASEILTHWTHGQVGREHVMNWLDQFQQLGAYGWIGRALLGQMDLIAPSTLSEKLGGLRVGADEALCVNKDQRGNFKSADVLGNLLTKRFGNRKVYQNPADAIDQDGAKRVVLVEDGLWSGTETIGVLDSMLGRRDDRLKTQRLKDPEILKGVDVRLAYVIGTDYGNELVSRALKDRKLDRFSVECIDTVAVAEPVLLSQMADPNFDVRKIIDLGPPPTMLRPHTFAALQAQGMPAHKLVELIKVCKAIGHQLLANYIQDMCTGHGWTPWSTDKLGNAATGMHGLGLSHAFGHSIPKASLPLFWGKGAVTLDGKRAVWRPLLPNS